MAIAIGAVWEVRAAGSGASDSNGGFYVSGGVDYSQQDAAQLAVSDAVTNGTTTVTSATGGFTSAMVGNGINIAGTCYQIAAYTSTNTVTVDRIISTATGLTAKVGGALASPGYLCGQMGAGNTGYIKAAIYLITVTTVNVSGGRPTPAVANGFATQLIGYGTTRGDNGQATLKASGISAIAIIPLTGNFQINVYNLIADGNSAATITGFTGGSCFHYNCTAQNTTSYGFASGGYFLGCLAKSCSGGTWAGGSLAFCVAMNNTCAGFAMNAATLINCIAANNLSTGFVVAGLMINCIAVNNSGHGFLTNNSQNHAMLANCVAILNNGYGYTSGQTIQTILTSCAGYSNTSGNVNATAGYLGANFNFVTLTANPFVNSGATLTVIADAFAAFALNNAAGGGKLLRAAGFLPYSDIGAVQHQDAGGGIIPVGMNGGIRG